jgi:hypothetical protein
MAEAAPPPELIETLALPDPDDRHVLAAAITGGAGWLVTSNRKDFPARVLSQHGIIPCDPDRFLLDLARDGCDMAAVAAIVQARAEQASGQDQPLRALLKRTGLPRLGKALTNPDGLAP